MTMRLRYMDDPGVFILDRVGTDKSEAELDRMQKGLADNDYRAMIFADSIDVPQVDYYTSDTDDKPIKDESDAPPRGFIDLLKETVGRNLVEHFAEALDDGVEPVMDHEHDIDAGGNCRWLGCGYDSNDAAHEAGELDDQPDVPVLPLEEPTPTEHVLSATEAAEATGGGRWFVRDDSGLRRYGPGVEPDDDVTAVQQVGTKLTLARVLAGPVAPLWVITHNVGGIALSTTHQARPWRDFPGIQAHTFDELPKEFRIKPSDYVTVSREQLGESPVNLVDQLQQETVDDGLTHLFGNYGSFTAPELPTEGLIDYPTLAHSMGVEHAEPEAPAFDPETIVNRHVAEPDGLYVGMRFVDGIGDVLELVELPEGTEGVDDHPATGWKWMSVAGVDGSEDNAIHSNWETAISMARFPMIEQDPSTR